MSTRHITLPAILATVAFACSAPPQDQENAALESDPGAAQAGSDVISPGGEAPQSPGSEFLSEARLAMEDLERKVDALALRYQDAAGDAADEWDETQRQIMETHRELVAELQRAEATSGAMAEQVRGEIGESLEAFTERVERARLAAASDVGEFVATSRDQLEEIDSTITTLQTESASLAGEAAERASDEIDALRSEADEIAQSVDAMADASAETIAESREQVTEAIASLSGTVRRQWLEMRGESTGE